MRVEALISHLPVVLFQLGREGRYLATEGPGLELLRIAPGEAVGQPIFIRYAHIPAITAAAQHDPLTGLPNRLPLIERLAQAVASARRYRTGLAAMLLGLDRFRTVDDRLGHGAGDAALRQVAQHVRAWPVRPKARRSSAPPSGSPTASASGCGRGRRDRAATPLSRRHSCDQALNYIDGRPGRPDAIRRLADRSRLAAVGQEADHGA